MIPYREQINEAVTLIDGMLDLLLGSIKTPAPDKETYQLRYAVGHLRANVRKSIGQFTIGRDIRACFDAAVSARADLEGLDVVRRYLVNATYNGDIARSIGGHSILMCISAISMRGSTKTWKSQNDVMVALNRMQEIFQQAKDIVADQMPVSIYNALNRLASSVMQHLARTKLQLPRVIEYRTRTPLPALTLSNMIFRVGNRSEEIVDENDIIHPCFCLRELKVLSR